jgi:hypothetical protein
MTDDRTGQRDLLPEEREQNPESAPDSFVEHRRSDQTVTPGDATR